MDEEHSQLESPKQDLGEQNLRNLVSTVMAVHVEDELEGGLSVTKQVEGTPPAGADQQFTFKVELFHGNTTAANINGAYGDMVFAQGVADFILKGSETKTAYGAELEGLTYKVSEAPVEGFTVAMTGDAGTIPQGYCAEARFVNTWGETPPEPAKVEVTVKKQWVLNDGGSKPASVTAKLLKDGAVFNTTELNEHNSWSHTWTGLDAGASWAVQEKDVPEGFTSTVTLEGEYIFVITNDDVPDVPDPDPEPDPDPGLPQTGINTHRLLAGIFGGAGMILLLAGLYKKSRYHGKHEA